VYNISNCLKVKKNKKRMTRLIWYIHNSCIHGWKSKLRIQSVLLYMECTTYYLRPQYKFSNFLILNKCLTPLQNITSTKRDQ